MPVSTECAAALLSFRYPSMKYWEKWHLLIFGNLGGRQRWGGSWILTNKRKVHAKRVRREKSFDGPKWSSLAQAKNYGKDRLYDRKLRTGWTHWPASMTLLSRKRRTWGTSGQPTVSWSKLLMHFREKRECKPKSKLNCNVLITNQKKKKWMN